MFAGGRILKEESLFDFISFRFVFVNVVFI